MIAETTITCPRCKAEIPLTESIAAPLLEATRKQYEKKLSQKDREIEQREEALRGREKKIVDAQRKLDQQVADQVAEQLKTARARIKADEAKKAKELAKEEIEQLDRDLTQERERTEVLRKKLTNEQSARAELLKKERELEDAKREIPLKIELGIQEGLDDVRKIAAREAEQQTELKLKDRDNKIEELTKQITDLKRRADQGSQQGQGETLEVLLEHRLRTRFPFDLFEPVEKCEPGADILQTVRDESGQVGRKILWESKRTKKWQEPWLPKLRTDQRAAGADFAVIVTQALPVHVTHFDLLDGIWVSSIACAVELAAVLREALIQLTLARRAVEGQETKTQQVYAYLTGPRFRQRIDTMVEKSTDMREDLDKERRFMTKQWAKREEENGMVLDAIAGMYGDLQGIAGQSLAEIEALGDAAQYKLQI